MKASRPNFMLHVGTLASQSPPAHGFHTWSVHFHKSASCPQFTRSGSLQPKRTCFRAPAEDDPKCVQWMCLSWEAVEPDVPCFAGPQPGRNPGVLGPRRSRGVSGPSSVGNRAKNFEPLCLGFSGSLAIWNSDFWADVPAPGRPSNGC